MSPAGRPSSQAGSIVAVPDHPDRWRLRISVGRDPITKKYRTVEKSFTGTEAQAKIALSRMVTDHQDGKITTERCSLQALLDRYVAHCESQDRAPKTVYDYRRMAKWFSEKAGKTEIRKLTGIAVDDLMAEVVRDKGQSSADHYFRFLRAALKQGVKWRLIPTAPTEWATAPSAPKPEPKAPDASELRHLLNIVGAEDPDLAAVVWTSAVTGMRRGEVCALTIDDIDLDHSEIIKRHAVSRVQKQTYVRATKTTKTHRVAMDPLTRMVIGEQIARVHRSCELAGVKVTKETYLWSDEVDHSRPIIPDTLSTRWEKLAKKAGVDHKFHSLRHYSITQMLGHGVSPVVAAAQAGHSSPTVTLNTYASVIPSHAHAAAALVAASLAAPES